MKAFIPQRRFCEASVVEMAHCFDLLFVNFILPGDGMIV